MQVDAQVSPICGAKGWYFDMDQINSFLIPDSFTDPELLDSLTEDDAQCKSIILETSIKYGQNGEVITDVFKVATDQAFVKQDYLTNATGSLQYLQTTLH